MPTAESILPIKTQESAWIATAEESQKGPCGASRLPATVTRRRNLYRRHYHQGLAVIRLPHSAIS
jgi:hypothetical protein